jgi:hypothetical protein
MLQAIVSFQYSLFDAINVGLPHYVAMDWKPENGCEIQNCCDGKSGILMRYEVGEIGFSRGRDNTRAARECCSDGSNASSCRVLPAWDFCVNFNDFLNEYPLLVLLTMMDTCMGAMFCTIL